MNHHEEDIRHTFALRGVRWTRQRGAVYAALISTRTHPTAEELLDLIRDEEEPLSLATVYNSLDALSEAGLCRRVAASSSTSTAARFEGDLSPHAHVAFPDGSLTDVPHHVSRRLIDAIPADAIREIERSMGIRISGVQIQLVADPHQSSELP